MTKSTTKSQIINSIKEFIKGFLRLFPKEENVSSKLGISTSDISLPTNFKHNEGDSNFTVLSNEQKDKDMITNDPSKSTGEEGIYHIPWESSQLHYIMRDVNNRLKSPYNNEEKLPKTSSKVKNIEDGDIREFYGKVPNPTNLEDKYVSNFTITLKQLNQNTITKLVQNMQSSKDEQFKCGAKLVIYNIKLDMKESNIVFLKILINNLKNIENIMFNLELDHISEKQLNQLEQSYKVTKNDDDTYIIDFNSLIEQSEKIETIEKDITPKFDLKKASTEPCSFKATAPKFDLKKASTEPCSYKPTSCAQEYSKELGGSFYPSDFYETSV